MSRSVQPTNYRRPAPAPVVEAPAVPCPVCQAPAGEPCAFTSAILPVINPGSSHHGRTPKPAWEAWMAMGVPPGVHYFLGLDGTAGALAAALAVLPPDTKLDLGGAPDGSSPGVGIWYYPHWNKAGVM